MDKAECIQVIRTTLTRRGNGKDDPIRIITQYWTLDGELLAEVDPTPASAAALNGELGGKIGLRFQTPGYAGAVSRY